MALVSNGFRLNITLQDQFGKTSNKEVVLTSDDFTAASADAVTYVTEFATLTEAEVTGYSVGEVFIENTQVGGQGNVGEKASITVNLGTAGKRGNIQIPAPLNLNVVGSSAVDGATVAALLAFYTPAGFATLSDGETVDAGQPFAGGRIVTVSRRPR